MAIKSVVKMGNTQLGTPSLPVKNFSDGELNALIKDMEDTMHEENGVGIAAPQIGCNLRVIMFGFNSNPRYPTEKSVPFTVLINPVIEILSPETLEGWEGCLSVPGLRGLVPRFNKIRYSGIGLEGQQISRVVEGFHARILQHECDHLDGILYPQRIKDMTCFGFEKELAARIWPKE